METFFAEMKRRHIYRVAAAYVVVAWLILQVVNNVAPGLNLPNSAVTLVIVLLSAGFPIALIFAWIFDIKATEPADGLPPIAKTTGFDFTLIGGLVLVIAIFAFQQFAPSQATRTVQQQTTGAPAATQPGSMSIAVLPFANVSGDPGQEFFSDGMTDEIIAALAKVPSLQVVARTSAFQFKGEKKDMRAIGQALSARFLIDGSVRKAGNRVRITAQLVQADNGVGVWTDSYDRELTDVFAIQEDIATAIAASLRVPLGLRQGDTLVRTTDLTSYDQYLRARALVRGRAVGPPLSDAIALLEQVVARDANFAPAWARLSLAYALSPGFDLTALSGSIDEFRRVVDATLPRAEAAARRAIELDAELADGYLSNAYVQDVRGHHLLAEELYSKALALDPSNPDALSLYANLLAAVGRLKEAFAIKQRALSLDPFVPIYIQTDAFFLWLNGQTDAAIAMLKPMPVGQGRALRLAEIYAASGRYSDAAETLAEIPSGAMPRGIVEEAVQLLRSAPAQAPSPQSLPSLGPLEFVYLHVGAPDRVLDFYERAIDAGRLDSFTNAFLWHPSYAPVRKTERFKAFVRKAGPVDYWRAKGWPEFCHPTTADDFVCG